MSNPLDPTQIVIHVDGVALALHVRRNPRARRLSLRTDPAAGKVVLVLPRRASLAAGVSFARSQEAWIRTRLAQIPDATPLMPGVALEVAGERLTIRHDETSRGATRRVDDILLVSGDPRFVARRVRDWLRAQARERVTSRAHHLATGLARQVSAVRITDTRSRWGSCAPNGRLSFCWRLVLAPATVIDYVVAHEVAHLVHLNHGPRFWQLVDQLTPHRLDAQAWLRRNGARLLRVGAL